MHKTAQQNLDFFKLHQNIALDYAFEYDCGIDGPHVIFCAATHGNETAGVEACIRLYNDLVTGRFSLTHGKITFMIGNPRAYRRGQRFIDSNMNRAFLLELKNDYEGRRAGEIRNYLQSLEKFDCLLDLHSVSVGDLSMFAYLDSPENRRFALGISPLDFHFVLDAKTLPGSFMEEAEKFSAGGFAVECGNHSSPFAADIAFYHTTQTLKYYGALEGGERSLSSLKSATKIKIYKAIDVIKPYPGFRFVDQEVVTGSFVKEGEVYAVSDTIVQRAPQDCYIVIPDKNPSPKDTDAGFLCDLEIVSLSSDLPEKKTEVLEKVERFMAF